MLARWQRIEPLAGVVFVVLAVIALITASGEDFLAEPEEVADYFVDNSGRIIVAELIGGWAIFAFFWSSALFAIAFASRRRRKAASRRSRSEEG